MLGQENYWSLAHQQFNDIVRANSTLVYNEDLMSTRNAEYRLAFQNALNSKFDVCLDPVAHSENDQHLRGYRPFWKFIQTNLLGDEKLKQTLLASIKALAVSHNIPSFRYLESLFITYEAIRMRENFQEIVEATLLSASEYFGSRLDIVQKLLDYFR